MLCHEAGVVVHLLLQDPRRLLLLDRLDRLAGNGAAVGISSDTLTTDITSPNSPFVTQPLAGCKTLKFARFH